MAGIGDIAVCYETSRAVVFYDHVILVASQSVHLGNVPAAETTTRAHYFCGTRTMLDSSDVALAFLCQVGRRTYIPARSSINL